MEEQLKQLKNRIQLLEAKMEFQRENTVAMSGILKDMGHDVDAIITSFEEVQAKNETRFQRLEKYVGLDQ